MCFSITWENTATNVGFWCRDIQHQDILLQYYTAWNLCTEEILVPFVKQKSVNLNETFHFCSFCHGNCCMTDRCSYFRNPPCTFWKIVAALEELWPDVTPTCCTMGSAGGKYSQGSLVNRYQNYIKGYVWWHHSIKWLLILWKSLL